MDPKAHWERVYQTKLPTEVSWYRPHLEVSLQLIEEAAPNRDSHIIDVGAGESTLVDDLQTCGYRNLAVLDISSTALDGAKQRLGNRAIDVAWICGDVTKMALPSQHYDVWHDRAVFHFLTNAADRAANVRLVARAVKPGGHVIVATFGPEGPTKCSGLDVLRYNSEALHDEFGSHFRLVKHLDERHQTPSGAIQQFTYCYCKISSEPS